jgi:hypothetical protein
MPQSTSLTKVILFTAHAPTGGGGGAILRSLCDAGTNTELDWRYTASAAAVGYESGWLGKGAMGLGGFLGDSIRAARVLCGPAPRALADALKVLRNQKCDGYWVVSHNEGLRIALELRRQTSKSVHLTVHDDWAGALCARSIRYRMFGPLADALTFRVLHSVDSVDVISRGMRDFYRRRFGVTAEVCHRYLPELPQVEWSSGDRLVVGHIGSIYSSSELWLLAEALKSFCHKTRSQAVIRLWGCNIGLEDVPQHLRAYFDFMPDAPEEEAVIELQRCSFVYAMYPFGRRLRRFAQTSLPTKLSTYVLAQRPILSHGPPESSLAEFMRTTKLGVHWDSTDVNTGADAIAVALKTQPPRNLWESARSDYFGPSNLEYIRSRLGRLASVPAYR